MNPNQSQNGFDPSTVTSMMASEDSRVAALLPGLKSDLPEVRIKALYTYRSAFANIGIQSEVAVLAVAALINDPVEEIRTIARQTVIEVDNRRSMVPALPVLLKALRESSRMDEADDIGRTIGCILLAPGDLAAPAATLADVLVTGSEAARFGAARATEIIISRSRMALDGIAGRLDLFERETAVTRGAADLISAIISCDSDEKRSFFRNWRTAPEGLGPEYDLVLQFRPLLTDMLADSSTAIRRAASRALKGYEADCAEIFEHLVANFADRDSDIRAALFEAAACCPNELAGRANLIAECMYMERHVLPMAALVRCVEQFTTPSMELLSILKQLTGLPLNEAELQLKQERAVIVIGNDYVVSLAEKVLQALKLRGASN